MIEKKIFVRMNKDGSAKDLQEGEYRHAENLVAVTDGVGASVRLENMLGMRKTGMPVDSESVCVGAWNYREDNKIYLFYAGTTDSIVEYDGVTDVGTLLVLNNVLDFTPTQLVYDVSRIENLLYFNDGVHGERKINIDYAKTGALNAPDIDERALSVIKSPPLRSITLNRKTDNTITLNRPRIRNIPLQFAARYVYDDDEVSVIGPISVIAPPLDWDIDDALFNYVEVNFSVDDDLILLIKRVELIVREGNDGVFYIYDDFIPEDFTIDNADGTKSMLYDVYLDRSGGTLSEQEVGQAAESVPRLSEATAIMEDRLFVTSSLEEYDVALEDWDCTVNLKTDAAAPLGLNDEIYFPLYYKENSFYIWGVWFEDEFGRRSAPAVRKDMSKQIPDNFSSPTIINDLLSRGFQKGIYNHPLPYLADPFFSGKPPIWAKKYGFARSENQSFNDWFQSKFLVRPLVNKNLQTEEPTDDQKNNLGYYMLNGYWYRSIEKQLKSKRDSGSFNSPPWGGARYFDIFIPDGFPIGVDKESIVRLAFEYPYRAFSVTPNTFTIVSIDGDRIRVKGLHKIDMEEIFYNEPVAFTGVNLFSNEVLRDDECFLQIEILNPIIKTSNPILYEIGQVYDVINPGLPGRTFQPVNNDIEGDCYYTAYRDANNTQIFNEDSSVHVSESDYDDLDSRIGRYLTSISLALRSPIADRSRAGNPIDPESSAAPGQYNKTTDNSRGRPTVEVPDQKELTRGNQVRFSRTYVQDSLINGLSNFPEENKVSTASDRGNIIKLVPTNEKILVAVHTRSITSLYINQKFINSGEGAQFLAQTDAIIGDQRKLLRNLGTTHPESVVGHDNRVYGFDSIMSEPWRRSQDGITPLALNFGMKTYFEEKGEQIRQVKTLDPSATITVLGGYDQWLDMYILTFSQIDYVDNGTPITIEAETIGFSERAKGWVSFYSFKPEYYAAIMNNLVSAKDQSIWRHMDTDNRNLFYETFFSSSITIVGNESNDIPKLYQWLMLSSTEKWSMTCILPDGKESILNLDNFTIKDGVFYANFLRDKNTPTATLTPPQTPLLHGEKLIGETIEITLTNSDAKRVVLDAVYFGYSPMTGHLLSQR